MDKITRFIDEYWFLSNFYPVNVTHDQLEYHSVENAYQAAKTLDFKIRHRFIAMSPRHAKQTGHKLKLRPEWHSMKKAIMLDLLRKKFSQADLQEQLLRTEDALLEEHNYWRDTYWGVYKGKGENTLGKLLMQVRKEIKHARL